MRPLLTVALTSGCLLASLFLSVPVIPQDDLDAHIDWSLRDGGAPCADCPRYGACCLTCAPPGNGVLPRSVIGRQAVEAAKRGACSAAVALLAQCQCHNSDAANLILNNQDRVCSTLTEYSY